MCRRPPRTIFRCSARTALAARGYVRLPLTLEAALERFAANATVAELVSGGLRRRLRQAQGRRDRLSRGVLVAQAGNLQPSATEAVY